MPSAPDILSRSMLRGLRRGSYAKGIRHWRERTRRQSTDIAAGTVLGFAASFYLIGFVLLDVAFTYSANPALREVWFGWFMSEPPLAASSRAAVLFVLAVVCLYAGHGFLLTRAAATFGDRRPGMMAAMAIVLSLLFVSLPPFLSTDVLTYYQQGWLIAEKGSSPYVTPPGAYGEFPGIEFMKGQNYSVLSPYGPLWSHLEALVYRSTDGSLWLGVAVFKLFAAGSVLCLAYLVRHMLLRADPANATRGALLVATSPLLLVEGPGMAHNDLFALATAFAGIALLHRGGTNRTVAGLVLVGVALLVKALVAVVPFALAAYWLRVIGPMPLLRLVLKAALVWFPIAAISGWAFVSRLADVPLLLGAATASLPYEIRYTPVNLLRDVIAQHSAAWTAPLAPADVKLVLLCAAVVGVVALMIYMLARAKTLLEAFRAIGPAYLAATVAASYWRQWYATWPVPFLALGSGRFWITTGVAYGAGALLTYAITRTAGIHY